MIQWDRILSWSHCCYSKCGHLQTCTAQTVVYLRVVGIELWTRIWSSFEGGRIFWTCTFAWLEYLKHSSYRRQWVWRCFDQRWMIRWSHGVCYLSWLSKHWCYWIQCQASISSDFLTPSWYMDLCTHLSWNTFCYSSLDRNS